MPKIYLINVGANTRHYTVARSPRFDDGSWKYVSFPAKHCSPFCKSVKHHRNKQTYSKEIFPFLSSECPRHTHLDPDWENMTYGDNCQNRKARALLNVIPNDTLLF